MQKQRGQRNLYFTPIQIELGKKKAESLGLTFNEWIKYLVTKEIEPLSELSAKQEVELEDQSDDFKKNDGDSDEDYWTLP